MGYSYQFMDIFIEYGDFPIKSELGFFNLLRKHFISQKIISIFVVFLKVI